MLEALIHPELYNQLKNHAWEYNSQPVTVKIYRARQAFNVIEFPAILIDYGDAVLDRYNILLNEIYDIRTVQADDGQDIAYTYGVKLKQSINLNLYDNDIRRIAELQNQLFVLCKKLSFTNATVHQVSPPRILDFTDEGFVYRRLIEVVCKFTMTYEEILKTIEEVETTVQV